MTQRIWLVCRDLAQRALPGDHDGDDVCDGLELFYQTDPRNPNSHPEVSVQPDHPMVGDGLHGEVILYCGERTHSRWVETVEGQRVCFTRKTVMLSADKPVLLATGGTGKPVQGPLEIAVSHDGSVEFDLGAEQPIDYFVHITLTCAGTGAWDHDLPLQVAGWPQAPVEAWVARYFQLGWTGYTNSWEHQKDPITENEKGGSTEIIWHKVDELVVHYVIEVRERPPATKWKRIWNFQGNTTGAPMMTEGTLDEHGVIGEYRVIPTKSTPP